MGRVEPLVMQKLSYRDGQTTYVIGFREILGEPNGRAA